MKEKLLVYLHFWGHSCQGGSLPCWQNVWKAPCIPACLWTLLPGQRSATLAKCMKKLPAYLRVWGHSCRGGSLPHWQNVWKAPCNAYLRAWGGSCRGGTLPCWQNVWKAPRIPACLRTQLPGRRSATLAKCRHSSSTVPTRLAGNWRSFCRWLSTRL